MKNTLFICTLLFLPLACIKDSLKCKHPDEITARDHLVDISPVLAEPGLKVYLDSYPQLQVFYIDDNPFYIRFESRMYYKGIIILNESYSVTKGRKYYQSVSSSGLIPFNIPISLVPDVTIDEAIKTAVNRLDFKNDCVAYRLGIIDRNKLRGIDTKDYRLAWNIEGNNHGKPLVIIDAVNGEVLREAP